MEMTCHPRLGVSDQREDGGHRNQLYIFCIIPIQYLIAIRYKKVTVIIRLLSLHIYKSFGKSQDYNPLVSKLSCKELTVETGDV